MKMARSSENGLKSALILTCDVKFGRLYSNLFVKLM